MDKLLERMGAAFLEALMEECEGRRVNAASEGDSQGAEYWARATSKAYDTLEAWAVLRDN